MPNLAAALKQEISRLARKEVKEQLSVLRRSSAQYRRDIAKFKRDITALEKKLSYLEKQEAARLGKPQASDDSLTGVRFSARSVRAQRKRLGLSAEEYGRLVNVSGQTIYMWEQGKSRPRQNQLAGLVAVRGIGKREATARLKALAAADSERAKAKRKKTVAQRKKTAKRKRKRAKR